MLSCPEPIVRSRRALNMLRGRRNLPDMTAPTEPPTAAVKICFVIAPIGEAGSDIRKRSDQILRHVIEPVAAETGYQAVRADRISEPGLITTQVIKHIMDAPLVIADLTGHNPNVFYELAIRHAVGKPLVQIIRKGESIPFDVAGMRTIAVDHQDLDSVAEAKVEIVKQVRAVEADPSLIHSPISTSINLENLRTSERPLERFMADIASSVADLRRTVGNLTKRQPTGYMVMGGEHLEPVFLEKQYPYFDAGVLHPETIFVTGHNLNRVIANPRSRDLCACGSGKPITDCHGTEPPTEPAA